MKIKFTTKKIFTYFYLLLVMINIAAALLTYSFLHKYVYQTIVMDRDELMKQSSLAMEDINTQNSDKVTAKIKEKSSREKAFYGDNIFD